MSESRPDARALFSEALDLSSEEERASYLEQACQGDAELRARVEDLLRAYFQAGNFLQSQPEANLATIDAPITERPGTTLGHYKLLQQIGEGGMGIVYLAEQTEPVQRKVALKIIKPGMDSRQVLARFEAERQALALMDHPNIARVLDAGTTERGRPFVVMELVKGIPITQYCDEHHLPLRQRLELFLPICQAVQHAHQKGIIHRDLKPSNVLIALFDGVPVPKVIDFGVAKATGGKLTHRTLFTEVGAIVGTFEYMSPEQAELNNLDVDTRSDIYSLGVLLYELLTGSTPLQRGRAKELGLLELLRSIREDETQRPSLRLSTIQDLPQVAAQRGIEPGKLSGLFRGELDWIVMKALEKDRKRRYETANSFAADVQRYLCDEPVAACPPSASYRLRKFVRRNKGPVLTALLLALALIGGIIGTTLGLIRATSAETETRKALTEKGAALTSAQQSGQEARTQLFEALLNQARGTRLSRQMGQRLDSLAALERAARIHPDERLRDEAIAVLALPDIRLGPTLQLGPPDASLTALDFDGSYSSFVRRDGSGVSIRRVPDGEIILRVELKSGVQSDGLRMSPNGQYLSVIDLQQCLHLWRVPDGRLLLSEPLPSCDSVTFSPDSRWVGVTRDSTVIILDALTGREVKRWQVTGKAYMLAFHPDNRKLAVGFALSKFVSIYDSVLGTNVADLPVGPSRWQVVAWDAHGDRLAVGGSSPLIQIWDVAKRRKLMVLRGHAQNVTHLSFHSAGDLLASMSWDGTLRLWEPSTGRQVMRIPLLGFPRFATTGQWLGARWQANAQGQLLEVTTATSEYRTIDCPLGTGSSVGAVSPDGRLLVAGMGGGASNDRLIDLSSGRELAVLPGRSGSVFFQSDGRELITCGESGLYRWPIQESWGGAKTLRMGPPRRIPLPAVPAMAARSHDGQSFAVSCETAEVGLILDLTTGSVRGPRLEHPRISWIALSPDGHWVATSGWHSDRSRLWDARTGKMVREWVGAPSKVTFTPDSRALIIGESTKFSFWDVKTGNLIRRLPRAIDAFPCDVAFSPDGKLMALELAPAIIHLLEVATGRIVAKLEDPHGDRSYWKRFTPDGAQLIVGDNLSRAIHVWDLRGIRARLKRMGLDWDWPELPQRSSTAGQPEPVAIEVVPGEAGQPILTREQKARAALARWQKAVAANPDNPKACNNLAWYYLIAPDKLRDVKAAVPLAEKAVKLSPGNTTFANTLGVAYYRAGKYHEAVKILRANLERQEDLDLGFDLYFLAMSYHRLNEPTRARDYYDWAARWVRAQHGLSPGDLEELTELNAEAAILLGVEKKTNR